MNRIISIEEFKRGLSRRGFCKAAGVGAAVACLPGCIGDGIERVGAGGLSNNTPPPPGSDLAGQTPLDFSMNRQDFTGQVVDLSQPVVDLAQPPVDLAQVQSSCPGGVYNTNMPPSGFKLDYMVYFGSQDAFVCRDGSGLYTLSSICTHAGCTMSAKSQGSANAYLSCPCHGAHFNLEGQATAGPVFGTLDHFLTCIGTDGNVAFDTGTTVSASARV
jgi:Rieske Fe-S protein